MYRIRIPLGLLFLSIVAGVGYAEKAYQFNYLSQGIIGLLLLVALGEFYHILRNRGYGNFAVFGIFTAAVALIDTVVFSQGARTTSIFERQAFIGSMFLCVLFIYSLWKCAEDDVMEQVSGTLFGLCYVYFPLSYLLHIRSLGSSHEDGLYFLLLLVLVAKSTDIGGYMVGKAFGKHKLWPAISPKKSWEGFAGGLALSVATSYFMCQNLESLKQIPLLHVFVFGVVISTLSLLGDLSESLLKRKCDVKDSNKLIPEFGGILDVLDSLIFVAPVGYYYLWLIIPQVP